MKTHTRRILIGITATTVLLGSAVGCAAHHFKGHFGHGNLVEMRDKAVSRISSKLDLTDPQKVHLETLADALLAEQRAVRGDTPMREAFGALIATEKVDRSQAQALLDGKAVALRDAAPRLVTAFADFFDSLDARQQDLVRSKLKLRHTDGKTPPADS